MKSTEESAPQVETAACRSARASQTEAFLDSEYSLIP